MKVSKLTAEFQSPSPISNWAGIQWGLELGVSGLQARDSGAFRPTAEQRSFVLGEWPSGLEADLLSAKVYNMTIGGPLTITAWQGNARVGRLVFNNQERNSEESKSTPLKASSLPIVAFALAALVLLAFMRKGK